MPAARSLAVELGVSRITVETAYGELESEGLLERRRGSGTYITVHPTAPGNSKGLAGATGIHNSVLERCFLPGVEPSCEPPGAPSTDCIDLSTGLADGRLFPAEDFRRAMREVVSRGGSEILGYGDPQGFSPFRESIARILSSRGIRASADEVIVTSGSQEAIALCAIHAAQGAGHEGRQPTVIVESPTYAAALGLFRRLGFRVIGVPMDDDGMIVEELRLVLAKEGGASLLYLMPNFQNPTGACLPPQRRSDIVGLAERYGVPLIEDDFVSDLRYGGRDLPALAAFGSPGRVLYSGTFSKMLAPGLRVGFLVAGGGIHDRLLELKYCLSMASPNLSQRALHSVVSAGSYERHLRRSRRAYGQRRDALCDALMSRLPFLTFLKPSGGLFAWIGLPEGMDAEAVAGAAAREGLLVYPATHCYPEPGSAGAGRHLRLNFAVEEPDRLVEAVSRLERGLGLS